MAARPRSAPNPMREASGASAASAEPTLDATLPQTLPAALALAVRERPDQEALVIAGVRLTYWELAQRTAQVAGGLQQIGIRSGDNVAICLGNCVEWVLSWFALTHLGATAIPVNTRWKDDEFAWAINYTDACALVFADRLLKVDFISMVDRVRGSLPQLRHCIMTGPRPPEWAVPFNALNGAAPECAAKPHDIALIQFTSGSTSRPKGVMLTQSGMLTNARGSAEAVGMRAGDRYFSPRPFFHVAASTGGILRSLVSKACLVSIPTFDATEAIAMMRQEACELFAGNDAMFLKLLESVESGHGLRLRGGQAAAGPEVLRQLHERLGIAGLCCSYGLSETSPGVSFSRWHDPVDERIAGWMWPLPGVRIRIRDPLTFADLPPQQAGEILVKGPSVMAGYYKLPDETRATFDADGWLITGDLGMLKDDGRLRFIGRLKDTIRVGGENLSPAEVEDLLLRHPDVTAAQVIGLPDARLGEVPVAFVALRSGANIDPAVLVNWARERIAGFKAPRFIGIVASFDDVMTGSGKPQKSMLRERAVRDFCNPVPFG